MFKILKYFSPRGMKHAFFWFDYTVNDRSNDIKSPQPSHLSQADVFQQRILLEQLKLIYATSRQVVALYTGTGLVLVYTQWGSVSHQVLLGWFAALCLMVTYRYVLLRSFQQQTRTWQTAAYWKNKFLVGLFFAEVVWASAGVLIMPEDYLHFSITVLVISGLVAGAVSTLSPLREAVYSFVLFVPLPIVLELFARPSGEMDVLGYLAIMYFIFIGLIGRNNYKTHLNSLTLQLQSADREKALLTSEKTIVATADILKMVAQGDAAKGIFNAIALLYESRHPGMRCSMLLLKDNKLIHGAAPSLPAAYCEAVNGLEVGDSVGSCGTSTYTGKRVLVENIATDSKWENIKDVALPYGMRCCWSEPIKDSEGQVLGAFGMYYDHPALPNPTELADLEAAAQLAGIVMERDQRNGLLQLHSNSLEQAGEAILITNQEGVIEYCNAAYTKITGYSQEEVLGQNPRVLNSGQQSKKYYQNMWHTLSHGDTWTNKIVERKKDGSLYTAHMTIAPVKDKAGKITHYVSFHSDLSELEALEEQFFQAQKLDSIGVLVGGIAHDFNNILAAIRGNTYLANINISNPEKLHDKLSSIDQLSERAAEMTQQLLTFARKDSVEMNVLSLNTFVEKAFRLASSNIPENIEHHCKVCDESLHIVGDKAQLQQLLMNLLNNARDAVADAEKPMIECSVYAMVVTPEFTVKHPDIYGQNFAVLAVKDNGVGIQEDILNTIFEPFFTTKEVGQGTGLGLAMVYGAVQRHGGVIEVESQPSEGTCFKVYIPLTQDVVQNVEIEETLSGQGEMILIVDDDADLRIATAEVLESFNYQVLMAENGEEAWTIFQDKKQQIGLIITDVVMPKLGGVELAQRVRQIGEQVPIIFATGYDRQVMQDNVPIAHSQVVNKPFAFEKLSQAIREMLRPSKD